MLLYHFPLQTWVSNASEDKESFQDQKEKKELRLILAQIQLKQKVMIKPTCKISYFSNDLSANQNRSNSIYFY
jgi:hypothetical protein